MKNKITKNFMKQKKVQSVGLFLNKNASAIVAGMMMAVLMCGTVFATGGADALWTTLANLLEKWITRLGGAVMLIGGIMVGLGWRHNDAAQKSDGFNVIIAGAIIAAVAKLTSQFFA